MSLFNEDGQARDDVFIAECVAWRMMACTTFRT